MEASNDASRSRCSASAARRRERAESSLTTIAVTEYASSANQLVESCSENVCRGGRKKKLNTSTPATATSRAHTRPHAIATGRTART